MAKRFTRDLMNREDNIYLRRALMQLSTPAPQVKAEYKRRFLEAYEAEPVEHKKSNAGRQAANLYLTEMMDPR